MDQDTACKSFRSTKELLGHLCLLLFISSLPRLTLATVSTSDVDQIGFTQIKLVKFSYLWRVQNFSLYAEAKGEQFNSPPFFSEESERYNWNLLLYPRGISNGNYLSVFLQYVTGNALRVKAEYKISILNSSYDEIQTIGAFGTFDRNGVKYGSPSIIGRDYVLNATNHVLRNDELAIYAEVTEFRIIQRPK
ncbi:speckle-type POZ protein-like isoform X1 [Nasonia vitripennis]|uniref:MATH domain-containing protein n=1 Tax=Nasonia vitripennis TaxID=7425 RepID=A0A7M7GCV6_NASVI|nr:speckle-type POZ protein-like isoform X1 [Nasonia vitripennis]